MIANSLGYKAELPNGKQVLYIDCQPQECVKLFQRWGTEEWGPIDPKIFNHTGLPRDTIIQGIPC